MTMNELFTIELASAASLFLSAALLQNALLVRALGLSALFAPDASERKGSYCAQFTIAAVGSSLLYKLLTVFWLSRVSFSEYIRPLCMALCVCVMYAIIMPISTARAAADKKAEAQRSATAACFNVPVFASALITATNNYSLPTTALYALGLCVGFLLAAMLVTAARRRMSSSNVPAPFRGLPATLLCLAGMALALQALSAA